MHDKIIEIASNIIQLFWKYFSSKIIHLQIKFESPTLSYFDWDRDTNWPVLTNIKKPRVPERVKKKYFSNKLFNEKQYSKRQLKIQYHKGRNFLETNFWKLKNSQNAGRSLSLMVSPERVSARINIREWSNI